MDSGGGQVTEAELYEHCLRSISDCMNRLEKQGYNALSDSFLPALRALYGAQVEERRKGAFK